MAAEVPQISMAETFVGMLTTIGSIFHQFSLWFHDYKAYTTVEAHQIR
jgi:hypothetical protein